MNELRMIQDEIQRIHERLRLLESIVHTPGSPWGPATYQDKDHL